MYYPKILSEEETLDRMLGGASIARFGDGEWRCAAEGGCTSQRPEKGLAAELRNVLRSPSKNFLVGLPNVMLSPRKESWLRYADTLYTRLLAPGFTGYASSFITRPDSAPWIDTPEYWEKVRLLWKDRDVVLVVGNEKGSDDKAEQKSLTVDMLKDDCSTLQVIVAPRQHAYEKIGQIEYAISRSVHPGGRVLMCLGTTATCLAWRLARAGIHAMDVGHIGMFMRHAGAYRYQWIDLISHDYRLQIEKLHGKQQWGADGAKHAQKVESIAAAMDALTVLDYGCGENRLAEALKPRRVSGYDPGIPERAKMPKPCDLVVCTDVLEHVEPDRIDAVIDHLFRLTARRCYLVISTREANAKLPDGRNAHLIVQPAIWWIQKLQEQGFKIEAEDIRKKDVELTLVK